MSGKSSNSTMRSDLGRARGLGSAKEGVLHWWAQRVSAIALVPLSIWFAASIMCLAGADHATAKDWLSSPVQLGLMSLLLIALCYHACLGLRVVIEDYVRHQLAKHAALIAVQGAGFVLGAIGLAAMLVAAFGA